MIVPKNPDVYSDTPLHGPNWILPLNTVILNSKFIIGIFN